MHANAKIDAHHHGQLESIIYVVRGRARMRWGECLEFTDEAGPGDFIFVPPYVPHQEINASADAPLECVLVRSDQEAVVVNLDIPMADFLIPNKAPTAPGSNNPGHLSHQGRQARRLSRSRL